jgi:hypothetical protein
MSDSEVDTSRTTVRTYVPAYQRDEWDEHAEQLDMSRSEFVRAMVQAGRRGFGDEGDGTAQSAAERGRSEEGGSTDSADANPGGRPMEERVVGVLSEDEFLSWDELLAALTEDMEERLESALQQLQGSNRVRYSGRNGGYTLDE